MPSSRQARRIRSAISTRLAMTSFTIMGRLFDDEQRLAELDWIAVLGHDRGDATGPVGFDLVHHLHGLDDAQHLAHLDFIADLDEGLRARGGCGPGRVCTPPRRPTDREAVGTGREPGCWTGLLGRTEARCSAARRAAPCWCGWMRRG